MAEYKVLRYKIMERIRVLSVIIEKHLSQLGVVTRCTRAFCNKSKLRDSRQIEIEFIAIPAD